MVIAQNGTPPCFWHPPMGNKTMLYFTAPKAEGSRCHRQVPIGSLTLPNKQSYQKHKSCGHTQSLRTQGCDVATQKFSKASFKEQTPNTFHAAIRRTLSIPLSRWGSTQQSAVNINSPRVADLIVWLMSTHGSWARSVGGPLGAYGSKPRGFVLCSAPASYFWALD